MHDNFMRIAIEKAKQGRDSTSGGPFGALIVSDGQIICQVHNLVDARDDGFKYSESYFNMDSKLRRKEFRMIQLLQEEALAVWQ